MGMDVYGLNPKMNKKMSEFPTMEKMNKLDEEDKWKEKWELLDNNTELREKYWKERNEYEKINKGIYFRNNCWYIIRNIWCWGWFLNDTIINFLRYTSCNCCCIRSKSYCWIIIIWNNWTS